MSRIKSIVTVSVIIIALLTSMTQVQAAGEEQSTGTSDLVTGAACFIITPVYGAFKLAFAGLGAIVGGATWMFTGGDEKAAQKVWDSSLKGTYIITPDHLAGKKPVEFVGSTNS